VQASPRAQLPPCIVSGQGRDAYLYSRGSRRLAFSFSWAKGQRAQSWLSSRVHISWGLLLLQLLLWHYALLLWIVCVTEMLTWAWDSGLSAKEGRGFKCGRQT